ncbi:MAG: hypothetical protein AB1700_06360 [Bacillota bacterium]
MSLDAMRAQDGLKTPYRVPAGISVYYYDYDLESEVVDLWNESFPLRFTMTRRLFRQNTALEMDCFVAVYDYSAPATEAAIGALFGEIDPEGTFPVGTADEWR